jgi:nitrate reductase gamma subunit
MISLEFARGTLHDMALIFMTVVYMIRIYWFTRFPAGKEIQAPTGLGDTNPRKGFIYSWGNIAMPWAMESTRTKFFLYLQFAVFHIAVTAAIVLMFSISFYFKDTPLPPTLALVFKVLIGAGFIVGVLRIIRRVGNLYVRSISSPDDHFAVWLLTVWFAFGFLAAPNNIALGEWKLMSFFIMGSFFLVYVPFSKISHYLYYPFTRYYLGKSLGRRGVFPIRRVV